MKLRGYRIELGEIEAALLAEPGVAEAYVMVHEEAKSKSLVAYVAAPAADGGALEPALLERLRARLPEHMVPRRVLALSALPRTRHGKVDRERLPRPEATARAHERSGWTTTTPPPSSTR